MKIYRITTDLDGKEIDAVILDTKVSWIDDPEVGKVLPLLFCKEVKAVCVKNSSDEINTYVLKSPFK